MVKILFLCHGNICRSVMAEFMMKDLVKKAGREAEFTIRSAAVSTEELGNPIYPPARRELMKHGVAFDDHRARQIDRRDLAWFDRIYYMDASNLRNLRRLFPNEPSERFTPILPRDVADPWYTGDFSATWDDLYEGCVRILKEMSE